MRKRSYKLSAASLAALSLPVLGVGVAAAQQLTAEPLLVDGAASSDQSKSAKSPASTLAVPVSAASTSAAEASATEPTRGWAEDDLDAYAAYWDAGYNYQQLLALADEWKVSEFEAKGRAGNAILAGNTSSFDAIVAGIEPIDEATAPPIDEVASADDPTAAFWNAGYEYEDAVALAEVWNTDSYQAKIMAAELIADGNQADVQAVLGR